MHSRLLQVQHIVDLNFSNVNSDSSLDHLSQLLSQHKHLDKQIIQIKYLGTKWFAHTFSLCHYEDQLSFVDILDRFHNLDFDVSSSLDFNNLFLSWSHLEFVSSREQNNLDYKSCRVWKQLHLNMIFKWIKPNRWYDPTQPLKSSHSTSFKSFDSIGSHIKFKQLFSKVSWIDICLNARDLFQDSKHCFIWHLCRCRSDLEYSRMS